MTFYELEKKCKRKKLLKIFIFFVFGVILIGIAFFIFLQNKNTSLERKKVKKEIKTNKTIPAKNKSVKNKPVPVKVKKQKNNVKKLSFIVPKINEVNNSKKIYLSKIATKIKKENNETNKTKLKKNDKKIIFKSFNLPSYQTCISIAKKYLQQKDYADALKWAKYANIQNKEDASSWIISAKALYYMGKKDEALKLLKIYNSYYNNEKVKQLIKEMSGE